MLVER